MSRSRARSRARLLVAATALVGLLIGHASAAASEEALPTDPRLIEASSLLSDKAAYPRVIGLYREVLAEDPDQITPRVWLARVLSWNGEHEASVIEYERLLAFEPPPADAEIERAEVLSWWGRYDEALRSFDRILKRNPENTRALLGKARIYAWSERRKEAAEAYALVTRLSDDVEARREYAQLQSQLGAGGDAESRHLRDSDGFHVTSVASNASVDLGFDTRFIGSAIYSNVGRDPDPTLLSSLILPSSTNGAAGYVGLEHQLGEGIKASAQLGYRWWDAAPGRLLARGVLDYALPTDTALGLELDYGDFLGRSDSFDAVLAGISATSIRGRAWQGFAYGLSAFAFAESSFVSDANRRIALGASSEYRPLPDFELVIGLSFDYLTFTERSILYYDPEIDVGGNLSLQLSQPLAEWLRIELEAAVGGGYAEEGGLSGSGFTYAIGGGPSVVWGGLSLTFFAGRSQSQRATTYTAHSFGLALGLEF